MADLDEETRKKVMEYQGLQQNLQFFAQQKQSLTIQLDELEKALEEVGKASEGGEVYRAVGPVFVKKDKKLLENELSEEKESTEVRKNSLEKQEKKLVERLELLKKELEASMKQREPGKPAN